jgi:ribonuclease HI
MKSLLLFTDGSVHPMSRVGYGAYLAVDDMDADVQSLEPFVHVKRFENTSSTQLEMETLLWALRETNPLYCLSRNRNFSPFELETK